MAQDATTPYVPALGYHWLTRLYDPLIALTMRERALKQQLVAQVGLRPGMEVLDFGCGTGTLALLLKRSCPQARVVGVDPDATVLALARHKFAAAGLDIGLHHGFLAADTFPPQSFDRIVSSLVLHHLTHDERAAVLSLCRTLLRAGGELHIADFGPPRGRYARLVSRLVGHFDGAHRIADNLGGRLAEQITTAGFVDAAIVAHRGTAFGTVDYLRAANPAA